MNESIDLVYTMYALEPNGGREKELLKELYRATNKYLVLVEPSYELADLNQRERMDGHGNIKGLPKIIEELGWNTLINGKFPVDKKPMNLTSIIIEKMGRSDRIVKSPLACPITHTPLELYQNSYVSRQAMLTYPIIQGIPCLLEENAIVTTKLFE